LQHYVNADGGFGKALEPNIRLSASSVIATTVALQYLARSDAPGSSNLVKNAMQYLADQYDNKARAWPVVPANVNDAAHAPWWEPKDISDCLLNPRTEILGYLYRWPGFFSDEIRDLITNEVFDQIKTTHEIEMHELLTVDRLLNSPGLPTERYSDTAPYFYDLATKAIATETKA